MTYPSSEDHNRVSRKVNMSGAAPNSYGGHSLKKTLSTPTIKQVDTLPSINKKQLIQPMRKPQFITHEPQYDLQPKIAYGRNNTDPANKSTEKSFSGSSLFSERISHFKGSNTPNPSSQHLLNTLRRNEQSSRLTQDYTKVVVPRVLVEESLNAILPSGGKRFFRSVTPSKPYVDNLLQIKYDIVRDIKGFQKMPDVREFLDNEIYETSKYLNQIGRKQREVILKYSLPKKNAIEQRKVEKMKQSKHYAKALRYIEEYPQQDEWGEWIASIKKANDRPEDDLNEFKQQI